MDEWDFDTIVIGWGRGGKKIAAGCAAKGQRVAVVEQSDRMYGGSGVNVSCMPSKFLVYSSRLARARRPASQEQARLFADAVAEKRGLVQSLRSVNFSRLNDLDHVEIFNGVGSFASANEVRIDGPDGIVTIRGKRIVINTGSTPVLPDIAGLRENRFVYTSETLLDIERLPERLIVVGGGQVALELASIFAGFGSQVTILQRNPLFLPHEDEDVAGEIRKSLEADGVIIQTGIQVRSVIPGAQEAELLYIDERGAEHAIGADAVLIAAGRKPNTAALNPLAAGLQIDSRGAIPVNEWLQTPVPNIWALGDVIGGAQYDYISRDDACIILPQLICESAPTYNTSARNNIPHCLFMTPPYAKVGLSEKDAMKRGIQVKCVSMPVANIPKAQLVHEERGVMKAVIEADSGRILGAMLLCVDAGELINLFKLAIDTGLHYSALRDRIYTHPSMSEAFNELFRAVE